MEDNHAVYDFYYSKKQEDIIRSIYMRDNVRTICYFKGQVYTECRNHGKKPSGNFDDFIFLGTGTFKDCIFH